MQVGWAERVRLASARPLAGTYMPFSNKRMELWLSEYTDQWHACALGAVLNSRGLSPLSSHSLQRKWRTLCVFGHTRAFNQG